MRREDRLSSTSLSRPRTRRIRTRGLCWSICAPLRNDHRSWTISPVRVPRSLDTSRHNQCQYFVPAVFVLCKVAERKRSASARQRLYCLYLNVIRRYRVFKFSLFGVFRGGVPFFFLLLSVIFFTFLFFFNIFNFPFLCYCVRMFVITFVFFSRVLFRIINA